MVLRDEIKIRGFRAARRMAFSDPVYPEEEFSFIIIALYSYRFLPLKKSRVN